MDRLSQLRDKAGGSRDFTDSTLDTTSSPSEAFLTANSSKYFSLSEVDSTFDITLKNDISPIKDVSLASTTTESEGTTENTDEIISNLSPIGKKNDNLDSFKLDTQIEAANILSGGVSIFDDNSYDGDELVIDDNVEVNEKSELKQSECLQFKEDENVESVTSNDTVDIGSKESEVVLQIDGNNVDAIDIGNGLYLYRKAGQEELAAVQIIDDDQQQPSFKFLKVRENAEGNLEVYEEIEIEVPKEVPAKDGKMADKNISSHVPIKDINKVINESTCTKTSDRKINTPQKEISSKTEMEIENKESILDSKSEVNLNGKMVKFSESRKMTYHSTPNKEGIPLTKTMVDQHLPTNRHSDMSNVKKTIEVHTDNCKPKTVETNKSKDIDDNRSNDLNNTEKEFISVESTTKGSSSKKENVADAIKSNNPVHIEEPDKTLISQTNDLNKSITIKPSNLIDSNSKNIAKGTTVNLELENVNKSHENLITIEDVSLKESLLSKSNENSNDRVKQPEDIEKKVVTVQIDNLQKKEDEQVVHIENVEAIKNKKEVPMKIIKEKTDVELNASSEHGLPFQLKNAKVNSNEKRENIGSIEFSNTDKTETITKKSGKIESTADIEIVGDECKVVPMEIDYGIESSIIANRFCVDKNKSVSELNTQACNKDHEEVGSIQNQHLNEPIVIDDDDVSIVEVIVDNKDKEKSECNVLAHETGKPININTENAIEKTLEENTNDIDGFTEVKNNPTVIKDKLVESLSISNIVNQTEIKKDIILTPYYPGLTEHNLRKGSMFPSGKIKESKMDNISKYISELNEPIEKPLLKSIETQKNMPINVLQQHGNIKSFSNVPKTQVSNICDKGPNKKLIETGQIIDITSEAVTKQVVAINESLKTTNKAMPIKQKSDSNIIPNQRKKDIDAVQLTESQTIDVNKRVQLSIVPVSKDGHRKEICAIKEKTMSVANINLNKPKAFELRPPSTSQKDEKKELKISSKSVTSEKGKSVMNIEISKVPKPQPAKANVPVKQDINSLSKTASQSSKNIINLKEKQDVNKVPESKPINNNSASAVPFGKWTEANRQEFLSKFKTKALVTSSNSNQLKNSNDLNRRDVLKKIDKQRQSSNILSKPPDTNRLASKPEMAAFSNKSNVITKESSKEKDISQNHEIIDLKILPQKILQKIEAVPSTHSEPSHITNLPGVAKNEACQRTGVVQNLIDKTIEGMIHRSATALKLPEESQQDVTKESSTSLTLKPQKPYQPIDQATLDEIEMKMNELHGIPFIERPPHELPKVIHTPETKSYSKVEKQKQQVTGKTQIPKIPSLLPYSNKNQLKDDLKNVIEVDSEDEVIEHEPITGDIDVKKKIRETTPVVKEQVSLIINPQKQIQENFKTDGTKKDAIITEKDFDKFVRRNSVTYENRITVNFDGKEPQNVIQPVVGKNAVSKNYSKKDHGRMDQKANHYKHQNVHTNTLINKKEIQNKLAPDHEDATNRNQSKLQKAYNSVLTAKRQMAAESPITIIEDKPVKVVYMDNVDYFSSPLNVEGQELSPAKKVMPDSDLTAIAAESLDSDILDSIDDVKLQDDIKSKTKHQRKQVLTPVEEPELELIEPSDLGIQVSPKKKRKTDEDNRDKSLKYPMRKKIYLLGSSTTDEMVAEPVQLINNPSKEIVNTNENGHKNSVSALDSLVKAAELIETQTDINKSVTSNSDSPSSTPVKRGRGRPRKYPLTPDGVVDKSKTVTVSPQKKPRLIDAKVPKRHISTDESDSETEIIKENWTMGKINENIVCPICNKLFRTENVVFKHVKHCTGPSPNRSDSDKRKMRMSQEFDTKSRDSKSDDMDIDDDKPLIVTKEILKRHSSKLTRKADEKDDIDEIVETHTKEKPEKVETRKQTDTNKSRIPQKNVDLVCEFCGCKFRQLSYLTKHIMLQHKNVDKMSTKTAEKELPAVTSSVYCCEVCKKEFRKLHHLVQHRIIHNPNSFPAKSSRKSSSELSENKIVKELNLPKQEDQSAGFRCEPCDKSFRKLHHLVEHRETHDGINRQKTNLPASKEDKSLEKPILHQCDVCKKTFKKLQHLNDHKEQHLETSSEKSDDKSVQSSLSTRDIIHECSLCYMVFPNEHSLKKHTIICQRKKRQSKLQKPADGTEGGDEVAGSPLPEKEIENVDSPKDLVEECIDLSENQVEVEEVQSLNVPSKEIAMPSVKNEKKTEDDKGKVTEIEENVIEQVPAVKRDFMKTGNYKLEVPEKIKKVEEKEPVKIIETPKKKTPVKDKISSTTKRVKTAAPQVTEDIPIVESSDDDDVRYMLNPNFKTEDVTEEKIFMKVRATKRNSLQIDRPNSKDLVKRRTSLQHPPKIPRLKSKSLEPTTTAAAIKKQTLPKLEPVPSTDSDDSETTKYSFPVNEKSTKPVQNRVSKDSERKTQRKSLGDKRKLLTGIAKRKSLGKSVTTKHKATPLQQVKKRTLDVEHRCDCGQLFSSAALLSRHTTLAHTPPRIRRRRSPPPDDKPVEKPAPRKSSAVIKPNSTSAPKKSGAASNTTIPKTTKTEVKSNKKSVEKNTKSSSDTKKVKQDKSDAYSTIQPRRMVLNRAVSIPGKIRKSRAEK